mmetsp:Transcript_4984/g.11069  ORF Transcript_4984/g.11069 Transcript_4984/m.11069 type:complete len:417 (+) Transcript_4984:19-1269(+)
MEGWLRKHGRLCGAASSKRRHFVLDSTQGVLFIRNGKTLVHLINLHCPMAVRQHGKGRFDIICASRAYELEAPDADEARRWVSALLPFTVGGRDGATAAADERGSFTRMITGNAHTGLRMWVGDLENCCDTGDLILFSTKDGGASAIRFFTGSEWNHVGIVLRTASRTLILEWAGGLYLSDLRSRLANYWKNGDAHIFTYRKLHFEGSGAVARKQILQFVDQLITEGRGSGQFPVADVIPGWLGQIVSNKIQMNSVAIDDDLERLFCSKTVAVCYKAAGVLKASVDTNSVFPKHFSCKYDEFMQYQGGARLGREIDLSFEPSVRVRAVTRNFLRATLPSKRFAAALRIQRAFRQRRARRLALQRRRLGVLKRARKYITGTLAEYFVSVAHRDIMYQLELVSRAKQQLLDGHLVDDV